MLKQLKVYELEESLHMPRLDYNDWENPVVKELSDYPFLNRLLLSDGTMYRMEDLIENKHEILEAYRLKFRQADTHAFINSVFKMYMLANELIEFSDIKDCEDLVVISHVKNIKSDYLNLYILKKIMNVVISEKEIIEVIGKELTAFDYKNLASIALSEDNPFNPNDLVEAKEELKHALKYRFMSEKTMQFVKFLYKLHQKAVLQKRNQAKEFIFFMDPVEITV